MVQIAQMEHTIMFGEHIARTFAYLAQQENSAQQEQVTLQALQIVQLLNIALQGLMQPHSNHVAFNIIAQLAQENQLNAFQENIALTQV
jgi:hypothetical protein